MTTKRKKKPSSHHTKKHEIKKAEPMPSLIFNEGTLNEQNKEQFEPEIAPVESTPIYDPYNPRATNLMWLGVICVTLVIFGLWSWSIAFRFSTVKWTKTPENNFYEDTKENWQDSFKTNDTEELTNRIKMNLTKIKESMMVAASSSAALATSTTSTNP